MMGADSLHESVHGVVLSGVSIRRVDQAAIIMSLRMQCGWRYGVPDAAFHVLSGMAIPHAIVPHCACLACGFRRALRCAGCLHRRAAMPPEPGASATGKGGRQDKRARHPAASKASLHVGVARHDAASPSCRLGRVARADADMSACFVRQDTL